MTRSRAVPRTRTVIGAAALVAALALTSCAATPDAEATTPPPSTAPSATPTPTPTEITPVVRPGDLTCETLIAPDVVAAFVEAGWEAQEDVFRIGSREFPDGLWCIWGAAGAVTASVQIYGWAGIDPADAEKAQTELTDGGWVAEETPDGVYVTENPDTTVATDDDGYGMTFLFGDGWVAVADTKEGLLVIERPA
ncbi:MULTISPECIES: hypothetical protein [unclassified Microbacterium]|uniref:hypothetical protein n=1 Tax=unclassified Microbacterium TaxID=2609290 RepID=UPI000C2B7FF4|nr:MULTISPECIES: hypothetical protein [unclassified Microbacterium]